MTHKYPLAVQQQDASPDSLRGLGFGSAALLALLFGVYHLITDKSDKKTDEKHKPAIATIGSSTPNLWERIRQQQNTWGNLHYPLNCNARQNVELAHPKLHERNGKIGDGGVIWIPRQAMCGGVLDLIISLHGIAPGIRFDRANNKPLYHVGRTSSKKLERTVAQLIESGRMRPVILAAPAYDQTRKKIGKKSTLWHPDYFDPNAYVRSIIQRVKEVNPNIQIGRVSFMGHSGANCYKRSGLENVARVVNAYAILMSEGTCLSEYANRISNALGRKRTILFHMTGSHRLGDRKAHGTLLGSYPTNDSHNALNRHWFSRMGKNRFKPWYSYKINGKYRGHSKVPSRVLREAGPRLFPPQRYGNR